VLRFAGQRWLLSHGDALCLQDTDYMQFRDRVRDGQWQQMFLAKPLAERQSIGRELRAQSEARKARHVLNGATMVDLEFDLDAEATCSWLQAAEASTLIHGHTHKPAEHDLGVGRRRIVLSDWDATASPARACVLRLNAPSLNQAEGGAVVERLSVNSACSLTSSIWD
jgi:UDP-2,3-diacylglucosamine hydrolase